MNKVKFEKQYDILINANGEYQDKLYKMAYYFKIIANNYYKAYIIDSYPLKINNNSKLTNKEKEEVKSLIRLGDSARLAILTIKANRKSKEYYDFYNFAYCS